MIPKPKFASTPSASTSAGSIKDYDSKAIYEAKKWREAMRSTGAAVQPVIPISSTHLRDVDNGSNRHSRLVREEEDDISDEDVGNTGADRARTSAAYVSSSELLRDDEKRRRDEQLDALRYEQGDSDIESVHDEDGEAAVGSSSGDDSDPWEREQIRRAVNARTLLFAHLSVTSCWSSSGKVTELKSEIRSHRATFYDQHTPSTKPSSTMDSLHLDEDMDIEVETAAGAKVPAFVNADGTMKKSGKSHRYTKLADLLEKLHVGAERRRETINTKRHHVEQNKTYVDENRVAIARCIEANERIERVFHLYQELRFFTSNVLNCLNEKMPMISAADATAWSAWQTRADDLVRRRAESRAQRPVYSSGWQSDVEEDTVSDNYWHIMGTCSMHILIVFN